jgi:hypothetical protein
MVHAPIGYVVTYYAPSYDRSQEDDLNELVFNSAVVSLLADLQCEVWEEDHLSSRTERFENGASPGSTISSSSGRRGRTRLAILG